MRSEMSKLYNYNAWANEQIINHLQSLPDEVFSKEVDLGFQSISHVIGHLVAADEIWLSRLREESPSAFVAKQLTSLEDARIYFGKIQTEIRDYLRSIEDMNQVVTYQNSNGKKFENTIMEILQHIVNHGTYHRGNIITMLRYQGYKGISTDLIAYFRVM